MPLNMDKPYAEFYYPNKNGMKYEQDGKCYNDKKQEISWEDGSLIESEPKPTKRRGKAPDELPDAV